MLRAVSRTSHPPTPVAGGPRARHDEEQLKAAYTSRHRAYELGAIAVWTTTASWFAWTLIHGSTLGGLWVVAAVLLGMLIADFTSGVVHWGFDTWGDLDTPVLGKLAIRTFRLHHVARLAITENDFVRTNGHTCGVAVIPLVVGAPLISSAPMTASESFWAITALFVSIVTALTSQIHKWAHTPDPPRPVVLLQRARLLLHPAHHDEHHQPPYTRRYCISGGWLNGLLDAIRFFETLERVVTSVTGALPREDDLGTQGALLVQSAQEPRPGQSR